MKQFIYNEFLKRLMEVNDETKTTAQHDRIKRLETAIDQYRAELATEKEHEQGWIDALDDANAEINRLKRVESERDNLRLVVANKCNHGDCDECRLNHICTPGEEIIAERDRYRDELARLKDGMSGHSHYTHGGGEQEHESFGGKSDTDA